MHGRKLFKSGLLLGLTALLLLSGACIRRSYPSIFDLVDYMIGVSLEPGRIMINARFYEWNPTVKDIQWAFGLGTAKNSRILAYEKIGMIIRHNTHRVSSLELLYDPLAGEHPCEASFQGSLFVNGMKISSSTKPEEIETTFKDLKQIRAENQLKVFSKAEEILVVSSDLSIQDRDSIRSFIDNYAENASIIDLVSMEKDRIAGMDSVKEGYFLNQDVQKPWLENYLIHTLQTTDYKFFYKDPIEVDFHFDPETKKLTKVIIKLGIDGTKRIEYY